MDGRRNMDPACRTRRGLRIFGLRQGHRPVGRPVQDGGVYGGDGSRPAEGCRAHRRVTAVGVRVLPRRDDADGVVPTPHAGARVLVYGRYAAFDGVDIFRRPGQRLRMLRRCPRAQQRRHAPEKYRAHGDGGRTAACQSPSAAALLSVAADMGGCVERPVHRQSGDGRLQLTAADRLPPLQGRYGSGGA